MYSVLSVKIEDLQNQTKEALECQRSARQSEKLSGEKTLKTSTDRDTIVGAFNSCSAVCGSDRTVRDTWDGNEILGTSITCSGIRRSKCISTATSCLHQRHSNVEHRINGVNNPAHHVPLNLLLRPDLEEPVRPRTPELRHATVVKKEVLRAGLLGGRGGGLPDLRRVCSAPRPHSPTLAFFGRCALWC